MVYIIKNNYLFLVGFFLLCKQANVNAGKDNSSHAKQNEDIGSYGSDVVSDYSIFGFNEPESGLPTTLPPRESPQRPDSTIYDMSFDSQGSTSYDRSFNLQEFNSGSEYSIYSFNEPESGLPTTLPPRESPQRPVTKGSISRYIKHDFSFNIPRFAAFSMIALAAGGGFLWSGGLTELIYKLPYFAGLCYAKMRCKVLVSIIGKFELSATIFSSFFFIFSGFLNDLTFAGPKATVWIGLLLGIVGWLLMGIPGDEHSSQNRYAIAIFLMSSVEAFIIPSLIKVISSFAEKKPLIISFISACAHLSFNIPVLINYCLSSEIYSAVDILWVSICYSVVGLLLPMVLTYFYVPLKVNTPEGENDTAQEQTNASNVYPSRFPSLKKYFTKLFHQIMNRRALFLFAHSVLSFANLKRFISPNTNWLITAEEKHLHSLVSLANIFVFLPCLGLGWLANRFDIFVAMALTNFFGLLMHIFSTINLIEMKYVAILFYVAFSSFISTPVYCYVIDNFDFNYFGTLSGIIIGLARLSSVGIDYLRNYLKGPKPEDVSYELVFMLGSLFINVILCLGHILVNKKKQRDLQPKKKVFAPNMLDQKRYQETAM